MVLFFMRKNEPGGLHACMKAHSANAHYRVILVSWFFFCGWVPMGGKEYIASQEALRKENFLQGRTFESSNSPRAGVKANNDNYKA